MTTTVPNVGGAPALDGKILIVSASDSRFMPFLKAMIASVGPTLALPNVSLACFDLGLSDADRQWLEGIGCQVATPRGHLGVADDAHSATLRSFLARPFLPTYFPGHDVYLWIDSDIWLQDVGVLKTFVDGARDHGMAIAHEREAGYKFQAWLFAWTSKHFLLGYGPAIATYLTTKRHLNAGFFAIAAGAPHWDAWARRYDAAIKRTGSLVPHDQFALNYAVHCDAALAGTALLDPGCNWICDRGVPMWNDAEAAFCKPYEPYAPIRVVHLAGPGKRTCYTIQRTSGGSFQSFIVRGASPETPVTVSPLEAAAPDALAA